MATPNGYILWRGVSRLDGRTPIVAIVTGCASSSANSKTGHMLQTWILRESVDPWQAVKSGADAAICGNCKHRPSTGGACYVRVYQAPLSVWRAYHRGIYPVATDITAIGQGKAVRLGSYGDPAAVPVEIWEALVSRAVKHTGYTHQWRRPEFDPLSKLVMASADTPDERDIARARGWRTFTVRLESDPLAARESVCPASSEAGHLTNCATCGACNGAGTGRKGSIAIIAHGALARRYIAIRQSI